MIPLSKARFLALALTLAVAGGCMDGSSTSSKHLQPLSQATVKQLAEKGMRKEDPILIRIYKEEDVLEVWKRDKSGRYAFFKDYEICAWSGKLGPKLKEGDKQAPEGFYTVTPGQMNPNSSYYLSFNLGYPNAYDRSHGRTGAHLMVHGACSSAGCYSMEDEQIAEIYALARDAFRGGQRDFQVQAYPFRMTPANMAKHAGDPNMAFWRRLKEGADHFEVTGVPPEVAVCGRDYVFNAKPAVPGRRLEPNAMCPPLEVASEISTAVAAKQMRDETAYQVALAEIKLQEQMQQADATPVMMAALEEQGSADYVVAGAAAAEAAVQAGASEVPVATANAAQAPANSGGADTAAGALAAAAPLEGQTVPGQPVPLGSGTAGVPAVASAFSGVWGKLVDITGLRALGKDAPVESTGGTEAADNAGTSADSDPDDVDPITTGTVTPATAPVPERRADAAGELPRLTATSAFAPIVHNDDPFAIFDLFATVGSVSVPADMAASSNRPDSGLR